MWGKSSRAIGVVVVTVLTFLMTVMTGGMTDQEWVLVTGVGVAAVNTAIVPNLDAGVAKVAKTISTASLAGLAVLAMVILGGLTNVEVIEVVLAALAAIGVTALPTTWPPATRKAMVAGRFAAPDAPDVPVQRPAD
jgi:hypothetical protein